MNIIKKYILLTIALALPAFTVATIYSPPADALFDSSKQDACQGASLTDSTEEAATCDDSNGAEPLQKRIQSIIDILSVIVGIIAVIMIIVNGFRFITSNGDSSSVSAARNGVIYAIVGLIIVALAQVIVRFVLARVL